MSRYDWKSLNKQYPWARFAATSRIGTVIAYSERPEYAEDHDGWRFPKREGRLVRFEGELGGEIKDWKESLEANPNYPVELPELVMKVSKWAQDRGLDDSTLVKAQFVKLIEEVGELASDVARGRDPRDSIGDTLVVLIILAQQLGTDLSECLTVAYDQIKDRTGKMVDGVFVKDGEEK